MRVLLLVSAGVAQEQTALLAGVVVDVSGARIASAIVLLEAPSGTMKTVHVDKEGEFEFRGLSSGTYQLQINAPGFQRQQIRDIQIGPGEQRRLAVITLRVVPAPECHELICL